MRSDWLIAAAAAAIVAQTLAQTEAEAESVQLHETMTAKKSQETFQRIIQYFNLGLHRKIHSAHKSNCECICESNFMGIRERIKQKSWKLCVYTVQMGER